MIRLVLDVRLGSAGRRASCLYCSCCFDLEAVTIRRLEDDGALGGYVCDACLEGGEDRLRDLLRRAGERYRRFVEQCEGDAHGPIDLPSIDLYRTMLGNPVQPSPRLKH